MYGRHTPSGPPYGYVRSTPQLLKALTASQSHPRFPCWTTLRCRSGKRLGCCSRPVSTKDSRLPPVDPPATTLHWPGGISHEPYRLARSPSYCRRTLGITSLPFLFLSPSHCPRSRLCRPVALKHTADICPVELFGLAHIRFSVAALPALYVSKITPSGQWVPHTYTSIAHVVREPHLFSFRFRDLDFHTPG